MTGRLWRDGEIPLWPPTVETPFACWLPPARVWTGHQTLDAAAQSSKRSGVWPAHVWRRDNDAAIADEWRKCDCPKRPYGSRSGRKASDEHRVEVVVSAAMLGDLDDARGSTSRSRWVREAIALRLEERIGIRWPG